MSLDVQRCEYVVLLDGQTVREEPTRSAMRKVRHDMEVES